MFDVCFQTFFTIWTDPKMDGPRVPCCALLDESVEVRPGVVAVTEIAGHAVPVLVSM